MKPYISGIKGSIQIIDAEQAALKLKKALDYVKKLVSDKKVILLVGTKIQLRDLVKKSALACHFPYIVNRWIGGTFTNFGVIKKRIDYFKSQEEKEKKGELDKYTKKERLEFNKEIQKLRNKFGGIKDLEKLPDAVFVLDVFHDKLAVKEAHQKSIPVIGLIDTNTYPSLVDYPILGNDDAISAVKYILDRFEEVVKNSQSSSPEIKVKANPEQALKKEQPKE